MSVAEQLRELYDASVPPTDGYYLDQKADQAMLEFWRLGPNLLAVIDAAETLVSLGSRIGGICLEGDSMLDEAQAILGNKLDDLAACLPPPRSVQPQKCSTCKGTGRIATALAGRLETTMQECWRCKGRGEISRPAPSPGNQTNA